MSSPFISSSVDPDRSANSSYIENRTILNSKQGSIEELSESYTNEIFQCESLRVANLNEECFVDCEFLNLHNLILDRCPAFSFLRCKFPQLKTITFSKESEVEGIFTFCSFPEDSSWDRNSIYFVNCEYPYSDELISSRIHGPSKIKKVYDPQSPNSHSDKSEESKSEPPNPKSKSEESEKSKSEPEEDLKEDLKEESEEESETSKEELKETALQNPLMFAAGALVAIGVMSFLKK